MDTPGLQPQQQQQFLFDEGKFVNQRAWRRSKVIYFTEHMVAALCVLE